MRTSAKWGYVGHVGSYAPGGGLSQPDLTGSVAVLICCTTSWWRKPLASTLVRYVHGVRHLHGRASTTSRAAQVGQNRPSLWSAPWSSSLPVIGLLEVSLMHERAFAEGNSQMGMLASVIPGIRSLRTPIASGMLWVAVVVMSRCCLPAWQCDERADWPFRIVYHRHLSTCGPSYPTPWR